ncbi:twin-arginine translocation signal domain-containing protein, partial [bacterium]|nr:twin-arginine translocation signal domain-containing protein [bacterium]
MANTNRRTFLKNSLAAGTALLAPTVLPASALGADGATAPSNRIVMGSI